MMKRRRDAHDELRNVTTINVTPLLDLAFLLLVVFIIMSTAIHYAVNVNPPQFNSANKIEDQQHIIIDLDNRGLIRVDNRALTEDDLRALLARTLAAKPDTQFYLRADQSRPYSEVMGLLRVVTRAGVKNVALVTVAEDKAHK